MCHLKPILPLWKIFVQFFHNGVRVLDGLASVWNPHPLCKASLKSTAKGVEQESATFLELSANFRCWEHPACYHTLQIIETLSAICLEIDYIYAKWKKKCIYLYHMYLNHLFLSAFVSFYVFRDSFCGKKLDLIQEISPWLNKAWWWNSITGFLDKMDLIASTCHGKGRLVPPLTRTRGCQPLV